MDQNNIVYIYVLTQCLFALFFKEIHNKTTVYYIGKFHKRKSGITQQSNVAPMSVSSDIVTSTFLVHVTAVGPYH